MSNGAKLSKGQLTTGKNLLHQYLSYMIRSFLSLCVRRSATDVESGAVDEAAIMASVNKHVKVGSIFTSIWPF